MGTHIPEAPENTETVDHEIGSGQPISFFEGFSDFFEKVLDKPIFLWYNITR